MSNRTSQDNPFLPLRTRAYNRRRSRRHPARGTSKAICREGTTGEGPNIALTLVDISEVGAQLLVRASLQTGQEVEVSLLAPPSDELRMTGRVVWISPVANRSWLVGVCFDKPLPYSAVRDLSRNTDA